MAKISLHIIAKDEVDKLLSIISKYDSYFDTIDIAIDDKKAYDEIKNTRGLSQKVRLFHYTDRMPSGRIDFGAKRSFLASMCKSDYYFRMDTDDEIANPEKIKDILQYADDNEISVITCYYEYSKDSYGNVDNAHYRETIVKNTPNLFWNKPIHECILPKSLQGFIMESNDDIRIIHNIDKEHGKKSVARNLEYLIEEYERDKEDTDPRTLAYLGRTYAGTGEYKKAVFFLEKHIKTSGWDEDRYLSWCLLSDIYSKLGVKKASLACAFEALQECPNYPDAYFLIHDIYFNEGRWEKAIEWAEMGFGKEIPKTNIPTTPALYTWRPMISLAECYAQTEKYEKALKILTLAKRYVPNMDYVKDTEKLYSEAIERENYASKLSWLVAYTKDKEPDNVQKLVESIPKSMQEHLLVAKIRNQFLPVKVCDHKDVVIFCGGTPEEWYPKSVESGIGGSEEAVICLSKELTKLGYKVTVYNGCGENEGEYDGVTYLNWSKFNPRTRFNILISWRANIFNYKIQARKKIVWVHDLPVNLNLTNETVRFFDNIVVLSRYHASLLPDCVPKEKIFISTNGLVPEDFEELKGVERDPHRIIYASSYNRGLETILDMWSDIKKEVPDANLHIYYGWDVYDKFVKENILEDKGWKKQMLAKMQQEGVYEHGRVGHKELLREYAKASIFAYPCTYTGEINCIALSKAIASGCMCVTNDFAVCGERNPHWAVKDELFKETLIKALKGNIRAPYDYKYISNNSWAYVARDWSDRLFPLPIDTEVIDRHAWIHQFFDKKANKKIIDIGANDGHMFEGWDRKNITSVDIDQYEYEGFVRANAEELPFPDKQFDIALLAEIVEHTPNPVKVLSEGLRVGKKVIITVPYEYEWADEFVPFNNIEKEKAMREMSAEELAKDGNKGAKDFYSDDGYKHLYHSVYYTPETLREDLIKAGYKNFKITKIRFEHWAWLGVETFEEDRCVN